MTAYDGNGLAVLDAAECARLLAGVPIGRVVFTDQALPAIQPVNFVLHKDAVIIRTGEGSKLAAAARNAVMAFQADQIDPDYHRGWSVTVIGHANEVLDPRQRAELDQLPLRSWAPGDRDHIVRISIELITGRRIPAPAEIPRPGSRLVGPAHLVAPSD